MPADKSHIPVVFACAGRSDAAELTYRLARELDRRGHAEMSCLAGIGAAKKPFLNTIRNRPVWVIDGCPIECGLGIFDLQKLPVTHHIRLVEFGFRKGDIDLSTVDMDDLIARILTHVRSAPAHA